MGHGMSYLMPEALQIPHETLQQIASEYCGGRAKLKDLAQKFCRPYGSLKNISAQLGWSARRRESLARAINPTGELQEIYTDRQKLFAVQSRFLQTTPDQLHRSASAALRLSKRAEKSGDLRTAGYLLSCHATIVSTARKTLGLELVESLELEKARSANRKKQNEEEPTFCPVPPTPVASPPVKVPEK